MIKRWQSRKEMGQVSPKSNWGQASWIQRKEEKMAIKGGGGQQVEGFRKLEKKSLGKNKKGKDKIESL